MKRYSSNFVVSKLMISVIGFALTICSAQAYSQMDSIALLLQQSPVGAGLITPAPGVHSFAANSEVALTAVPKPGYQFVYWIGDVSDPTKNSTFAYLDTPKIIIAVFERIKYQFLAEESVALCIPAESTIRSPADYARGGGGGIGERPHEWGGESKEPPSDEDFPVPDQSDENDFPVPEVPEPATGIMFLLGTLLVFARNRRQHQPT